MDQLDESDVNIHERNTSINHFAPLFKSDDVEVTKTRKNPK